MAEAAIAETPAPASNLDFAMEAGDLAALLGRVKGCVPSKTTIPLLRHVVLEGSAGTIRVRATSIEMDADAGALADVKSDGKAALPGEMLYALVSRFPKTAVVSISVEGDRASVVCKSSRSNIRVLPLDGFPDSISSRLVDPITFTMPAADLVSLLSSTSYAIGGTADRPWLSGIHLKPMGGHLAACASDGLRLGLSFAPLPAGAEAMSHLILPAYAVREIMSAIAKADGDVELSTSGTAVAIRIPGLTLATRLVEAQWIGYERFVPAKGDAIATVQSSALEDAVGRVQAAYSGANVKAPSIVLSTTGSRLAIASGREALDEVRDDIDATVHRPSARLCMDIRFLSEMLKFWPDTPLEIQQDGPGRPILFWSHEHPNAEHIIMPMKG